MANRSEALARKPSSLPSPRTGRAHDIWRIGAAAPTAHELYFGRLHTPSPQLPQLEDAFFSDLWVRFGTSKTTYHHRLDDLNRFVEPLLPPDRPLEIMDVAVSSGVSTVEWMQSLGRAGIAHHMVAGDAVIDAWLISFGQRVRALIDRTGFLMQLDIGGRAHTVPRAGCLARMRHMPAILLIRSVVRLFGAALSAPQKPAAVSAPHRPPAPVRRWGITCSPLQLVTRSLLEQPHARVVEDDILRDGDCGQRYHALRAANILNLSYFDTETLRRMLRNLRARLRPGGLLIVCRTMPEGRNDATAFRLDSIGALSPAGRLNEGSEIEELVLSLDKPA